jgi:hypothetical protein
MKYLIKLILSAFMAIGLMTPITAWSLVDPHCTDGECTEYVEDCWNQGKDVVCLNAHSENPITMCLPFQAVTKLYLNHPDVCRSSTCDYPQNCNDLIESSDTSENPTL